MSGSLIQNKNTGARLPGFKVMSETLLPYIARAPWYLRAFMLGGYTFVIIIFWLADDPTALQFWQESPLLFRVAMVVGVIGISVGAASLLFEKTVFTETEIKHRTKFLRRMSKPYSDIESLVYESQTLGRPESLKIIFMDSSKILITGGQAKIGVIIDILKTHADGQIVIRHR